MRDWGLDSYFFFLKGCDIFKLQLLEKAWPLIDLFSSGKLIVRLILYQMEKDPSEGSGGSSEEQEGQ